MGEAGKAKVAQFAPQVLWEGGGRLAGDAYLDKTYTPLRTNQFSPS